MPSMKMEKAILRIEAWDDNGSGWDKEYVITVEKEFEFETDAQWVHSKNAVGMKFVIYVTYFSSGGNVKEIVQLMPEAINEISNKDSCTN